jgi:hypothetical protein
MAATGYPRLPTSVSVPGAAGSTAGTIPALVMAKALAGAFAGAARDLDHQPAGRRLNRSIGHPVPVGGNTRRLAAPPVRCSSHSYRPHHAVERLVRQAVGAAAA